MEPLRIGFIGAGEMARWAIFPALHFAPINLVAVCDLEAGKAKRAAEKFGSDSWYTDYQQMLSKAEMEALVIQMHPRPRQQIVEETLKAGYHVLVPKPPAPNFSDCLKLSDTAKQSGVRLMVNFERRFSFAVRKAVELMRVNTFGNLTQFMSSFCSGKYDQIRGKDYRGHLEAYLLDFAIHHLDLARFFCGEVDQMSVYHNEMDSAASFALALQFTNGAVGSLQLNSQRIWWRNYDRIELTGQGEYLVLDGIWSIRHYGQRQNTFTENYSDERSGELTGDAFALIEFVKAIREDREPIGSIADALETMRLYQAVYDAVLQKKAGTIDWNPKHPTNRSA